MTPDSLWLKRAQEHDDLATFFAKAGNEARASVHRRLAVEHMARAFGTSL